MMKMVVVHVLLLLAYNSKYFTASADFVLEVQIHSYSNAGHMKSDGSCCDPSQLDRDDYTPSGCNVDCDNRFIFCGANLGAKDSTDCNLGLVRTGYVGGDVIVAPFEEKNGNSNSNFGNVVELRGKTWRGGFLLLIRVMDIDGIIDSESTSNSDTSASDDDIDNDELVTTFSIKQELELGASFTQPESFQGANAVGVIELSFRAACTENYFGADCATFCEERDDELGHFTCDGEGNKVCLQDYKNPSTNCTQDLSVGSTEQTLPVPVTTEHTSQTLPTEPIASTTPGITITSGEGNSANVAVIGGVTAGIAIVIAVISLLVVFGVIAGFVMVRSKGNRKMSQASVEVPLYDNVYTKRRPIEKFMPGDNPVYGGEVSGINGHERSDDIIFFSQTPYASMGPHDAKEASAYLQPVELSYPTVERECNNGGIIAGAGQAQGEKQQHEYDYIDIHVPIPGPKPTQVEQDYEYDYAAI